MVPVTYERGYVSDDSFADAIIHQLQAHQGKPTFVWGISMENHQTYYAVEDPPITVSHPALSGEVLDAVTTYTQGVYHSALALDKLIQYVDNAAEDTLVVFFGDHLPTLGTGYAAYRNTGYFDNSIEDTSTRKAMFGTPYLIYANYPLQESKDAKEISDYYLLALAAKIGGTDRSAYMNYLLKEMETYPYYNVKLLLPADEGLAALRERQQLLTYDRLVGEQYSK